MTTVYNKCEALFPHYDVEYGKEPITSTYLGVSSLELDLAGGRWIHGVPANFAKWMPIVGNKPNPFSWLGSVKWDVDFEQGAPPTGLNFNASSIKIGDPCRCTWKVKRTYKEFKLNLCTGYWDDIGERTESSQEVTYGKVIWDPIGGIMCNCAVPN